MGSASAARKRRSAGSAETYQAAFAVAAIAAVADQLLEAQRAQPRDFVRACIVHGQQFLRSAKPSRGGCCRTDPFGAERLRRYKPGFLSQAANVRDDANQGALS